MYNVAKRTALRKNPTSKLHTPRGYDLCECITSLEGTFFDADHGGRQFDDLELLTTLPRRRSDGADASVNVTSTCLNRATE